MTGRLLATGKATSNPLVWNHSTFFEFHRFLTESLPELLEKKTLAIPSEAVPFSSEKHSFFTSSSVESVPSTFLVIPIWEHLHQSQIQNVLKALSSMGVYPPVQNIPQKLNVLTNREQEVLQLLAIGKSYKTIANCLSISLATVKFHIKNLYIKLNVGNREDAIEWARQNLVNSL